MSQTKDPKNTLNAFLQRKNGRNTGKGDILYTVEKYEEGFQAILQLPCLGAGMEFVGELGATAKEAERNAAEQAINTYADEIAELDAKAKEGKLQRTLASDTPSAAPAVKAQAPSFARSPAEQAAPAQRQAAAAPVVKPMEGGPKKTGRYQRGAHTSIRDDPKGTLNQLLSKLLGKSVRKEDMDYQVMQSPDGLYQCSLSIAVMRDGATYVGETSEDMAVAQRSAARIALTHFALDRASSGAGGGKAAHPHAGHTAQPVARAAVPRVTPLARVAPARGVPTNRGGLGSLAATQQRMLMQAPRVQPGQSMFRPTLGSLGSFAQKMTSQRPTFAGKVAAHAAATRPAGAPVAASKDFENPRGTLQTFLQRHLGRPVVKGDVATQVDQIDADKFQATLTLNCLNGKVFKGAVSSTGKEASDKAAVSALRAHASLIAAQPAGTGRKRKAGAPDNGQPQAKKFKGKGAGK